MFLYFIIWAFLLVPSAALLMLTHMFLPYAGWIALVGILVAVGWGWFTMNHIDAKSRNNRTSGPLGAWLIFGVLPAVALITASVGVWAYLIYRHFA